MKSNRLITFGFLLVTLGMVLPFLMVIQVLPTGFLLSFVGYAATTSGLFLGLIGAATHMRANK
jgi:uncharacterized membrane protein